MKFKKVKKGGALAALTAIVALQSTVCFAGGSKSDSSTVNGAKCWAQLYYAATVAEATTQIETSAYVEAGVAAYCEGASVGRKTTYGSATDDLVATATAYNGAGTIVIGAKSTHKAQKAPATWTTILITGTTW